MNIFFVRFQCPRSKYSSTRQATTAATSATAATTGRPLHSPGSRPSHTLLRHGGRNATQIWRPQHPAHAKQHHGICQHEFSHAKSSDEPARRRPENATATAAAAAARRSQHADDAGRRQREEPAVPRAESRARRPQDAGSQRGELPVSCSKSWPNGRRTGGTAVPRPRWAKRRNLSQPDANEWRKRRCSW